jgi:spermidine/putrescine transport system permease protein
MVATGVLALPAVLIGIVFVAAPLIAFGTYSLLTTTLFGGATPFTFHSYDTVLSSSLVRTLARNSALVGVFTAIPCVVIGLPVAYWLRYVAGRWQMPVLFLITTTMFAGYLVRIYAWRTILGTNGVLNSLLMSVGVIDHPITTFVFSRFAVCVALVHIYLPYAILVFYASLNSLSPAVLEAAEDLGARPRLRWTKVILPMMAAPIATVFVFLFVLAAGDYVTPQLLGGTNGVMLGVFIQFNMTTTGDWPLAAATSVVMLATFAVGWLLVTFLSRRIGTPRPVQS